MRTSRVPSTSWWTRMMAAACLLLTLEVATPARADCTPAPEVSGKTLPSPGTCRLVSIGPEMVLEQDSNGRFTMAEEPPPKRSRGRNAAVVLLGAVTAGALLVMVRNDKTIDIGSRAGAAR